MSPAQYLPRLLISTIVLSFPHSITGDLIVDGDATFNNPVTFTDSVTFTQPLTTANLIVDGYLILECLGSDTSGTQVSFSNFGSDCNAVNVIAHNSVTLLRIPGAGYRFAFAYCSDIGGMWG